MRQDGEENPDAYPTWYIEMQDWLRRRGFAFVEIQLDQKTWMPLPFPAYAIFIGPHATGARHAIVGLCEDGKFIPVFDPLNPGGNAAEAFVKNRVEAVCLLAPLDPGAMALAGQTPPSTAELVFDRQSIKAAAAQALNGNAP